MAINVFKLMFRNVSEGMVMLLAALGACLVIVVVISISFLPGVRYDDVLEDEVWKERSFHTTPDYDGVLQTTRSVPKVHVHTQLNLKDFGKDGLEPFHREAEPEKPVQKTTLPPEPVTFSGHGVEGAYEIDIKSDDGIDAGVTQQILAFEAMAVPGLGDGGEAVELPEQSQEDIDEQLKLYSFNKYVSDKISIMRTVKDIRHEACKVVEYDSPEELPKASVVIIFCNEALSTVLRTIWSVINKTPLVMLQEIVLVDDGSTSEEMTDLLPKYLKLRMKDFSIKLFRIPRQSGLIKAKLLGAEKSVGEIIVFLDSHCEPVDGWLEPLAHYLKYDRTAAAIPIIDAIDDKTLQYMGGPGDVEIDVGSFTWTGMFIWDKLYPIPEDRKASDPASSPTMAGGLFAMNREYFWESGSYDVQMEGWGGENLEMSWRLWMCGGSLITIPCSHVGHIFRATNPYPLLDNAFTRNTKRAVEVWTDNFSSFFYELRPDLLEVVGGDMTERFELKKRLGCKNFTWYLDTIATSKFHVSRGTKAWGKFRNPLNNVCFDSLQRDDLTKNDPFFLGQYKCHDFITPTQEFAFSNEDEIRNEMKCAKGTEVTDGEGVWKVEMFKCDRNGYQKWSLGEGGALMHVESGLCITSVGPGEAELELRTCDGSEAQRWEINNWVQVDQPSSTA